MTTPLDGDIKPQKGPARRRRRKNRSAGSSSANHHGAVDPNQIAKGEMPSSRSESGEGSKDVDSAKAGTNDATSVSTASKKRRRNRRRKGNGQNGGHQSAELRNVRAPVTPTPDVTFKEESRTNEGGGGKRQRWKKKRNQGQSKQQQLNKKRLLYAALDLGTNNCRLLVVTPQERGRFRVVDSFSRIVRLGEGLGHSGELSQAAMDRSVEALKICAEKLKSHDIKNCRLIATEACRQAENGETFLKRVTEETGLELEIVNRETEARLAAEGCGSLLDKKAEGAVLFDIGGGSSELILVNGAGNRSRNRRKKNTRVGSGIADRIAAWTSLPLGVVTLSERFGGGGEVSRDIFQKMIDEVVRHIDEFEGRDQLAKVWGSGRVHLLGTSGTVTTIAGVHLRLPKYDRRKVDGIWLRDVEIDRVVSDLLEMNFDQRASNPCIGQDRADLVLAGCAILEAIRKTWPTTHLRVADRGLREGLLTEMISSDGAWLPFRRKAKYGMNKRTQYGQRPVASQHKKSEVK